MHRLQPFTPTALVHQVEVELELLDVLSVRWRIVGDVRVPEATLDPLRLWEHTCCELFVAPASGDGYEEWNVSPTGQTTRFAFASYRARVSVATPVIDVRASPSKGALAIEARLPRPDHDARLSLTAVIEDVAGELSYWAVHHPCDRPDFHHRDGFVVRLP